MIVLKKKRPFYYNSLRVVAIISYKISKFYLYFAYIYNLYMQERHMDTASAPEYKLSISLV